VGAADDLVFIGANTPLTATADGRDVTAASEWTVEGTALHVVSPGVVHADHSGSVHVWAKYQGVQGQIVLRVLPDMTGHFVGQYVVDSCDEAGGGGTFCALPGGSPTGTTAPFEATFTQARESVTGTISVGGIVSAPFTTTLSAAGELAITLRGSDEAGTSLIETFALTSETVGRLDGTLMMAIQNADARWHITAHLADVVRQ
jgi:hypothetical protein